MVYNGYYKVMSNIPKSWDIYQPLFVSLNYKSAYETPDWPLAHKLTSIKHREKKVPNHQLTPFPNHQSVIIKHH